MIRPTTLPGTVGRGPGIASGAHILGVPDAQSFSARWAAAWALVRQAGLTERAAGEILGMGTGSAVSQQLAKWRRNVSADARYQSIDTELERKLATINF